MNHDLEQYPVMKDSGVPWLGRIPAHWSVHRNGRLFVQRNETGFPDLPILEVSLRTGVRIREFEGSDRKQVMSEKSKYKRARRNDVVYNMMRMWQGAVGVAPVDGLVSPAYVVAKPLLGTEPRYFDYLFRTDAYMKEVNNYSRGIVSDRNRLYWDEFKQIPSPVPPSNEQESIVRFLRDSDRRVGRYIRAKQELIKLLEEQKQAIIHRAITRGLDRSVRLKPSGVEWLGEVPEHWEVVPFKRRVGFQEGPGIMAADFRDEGVPLLRISCLRGEIATLEGCNFLDPQMVRQRWRHFAVQPGDYLLSASANTGSIVLATDTVANAIPYTGILRLWATTNETFMPFIRLYIGCRPFQEQIEAAKSGVAIEHFGPTHLKRMYITLPPRAEQEELVTAVHEQTAGIADAIVRARREIVLLREYRTRLIADVVTGKLDVRAAVRNLPKETDEPDASEDSETLAESEEDTADVELDPAPDEVEA